MAVLMGPPTAEEFEGLWIPIVGDAVPRLMQHQRAVAALAVKLAEFCGLDLPYLYRAAAVHDIGRMPMLGVTEHPHRLNAHHRKLVELHVLISSEVARTAGLPDEAVLAIRHHHERWDGTGYPDGLRGEEIPIGARVLAVADATVSMAERRGYNNPRTIRDVCEELTVQAGRQFDPQIARNAAVLVSRLELQKVFLSGNGGPPRDVAREAAGAGTAWQSGTQNGR